MNVELRYPCHEYKESFLKRMRESDDDIYYGGHSFDWVENSFDEFLKTFKNYREGVNLKEGWVPDSHFWIIADGEYAGRIDVRHWLNDHLTEFGGHVGYEIATSMRRKGIATEALRLVLPEAKKLGIDELLITCNDDNIASIKIIENNGGVLLDKIKSERNPANKMTRRYKIIL